MRITNQIGEIKLNQKWTERFTVSRRHVVLLRSSRFLVHRSVALLTSITLHNTKFDCHFLLPFHLSEAHTQTRDTAHFRFSNTSGQCSWSVCSFSSPFFVCVAYQFHFANYTAQCALTIDYSHQNRVFLLHSSACGLSCFMYLYIFPSQSIFRSGNFHSFEMRRKRHWCWLLMQRKNWVESSEKPVSIWNRKLAWSEWNLIYFLLNTQCTQALCRMKLGFLSPSATNNFTYSRD